VTRLGVIADTHGLMRREALRALTASDLIVHAGDVGTPDVLAALREIAPVVAVRGNNDRDGWARRLPRARTLTLGAVRVHIVHDVNDLVLDLVRSRIRLVLSGHSHRPSIHEEDGVLFINPGSAGPRRFALPVSVARCLLHADRIRARLVELPIRPEPIDRAPASRGHHKQRLRPGFNA
jgi:putative phosphoesterase